jgi:hypothetical protein
MDEEYSNVLHTLSLCLTINMPFMKEDGSNYTIFINIYTTTPAQNSYKLCIWSKLVFQFTF